MNPQEAKEIIEKISQEKIDEIILMRAKGSSLNKIAQEVHITKSRVSLVVKHFESNIRNEVYCIAEENREKYKLTKVKRIEYFMEQLNKIYKELESRDLKQMKTKELIDWAKEMESKLFEETHELKLKTGVKFTVNEGLNELMDPLHADDETIEETIKYNK